MKTVTMAVTLLVVVLVLSTCGWANGVSDQRAPLRPTGTPQPTATCPDAVPDCGPSDYLLEMLQATTACTGQFGGEVTASPVLDEDGNWTVECEVPCWAAVVEGGGEPDEYCGTDVDPEAEAAAREWVVDKMAGRFSLEWLLSDIQSVSAEEWVETCYLDAAERSLGWGEGYFFQRWKETWEAATWPEWTSSEDYEFVAARLREGSGEYGDALLHACTAELLTPQEMESWAS